MIQLLRSARRWLWGAIALTLIVAAVLLSAARLALPFAGEYREQIEQYLERQLDAPITIGQLDVEWHGLGPRLRVEELAIAGAGEEGAIASIERAYLALDLGWPRGGSVVPLRVRDLVLAGIDARLALDARGRPTVSGVRIGSDQERSASEMLRRLVAVERLRVRDARITITRGEGDPVVLRDVAIRLLSEGERHRVAVRADLPPAYGGTLQGALDFRGPPGAYREWRGTGYLRASDLALASWLELAHGYAGIEGHGRGQAELWAHWAGGTVQRIQARTELHELALTRDGGTEAEFARIAGRAAWSRTRGGWRIDGGDVTVERDGRRWHAGGFSIAHEPDAAAAARWRGRVDLLQLEDVLALARVAPLSPGLREPLAQWMDQHEPRGRVRGLRFSAGGGAQPVVRARLEDAGWDSGDGVPGVTGLDAELRWEAGDGRIDLATANAVVRAPWLFREPLPVADLRGRIDVTRAPDGMRIRAPRLEAANGDVRTASRLDLRLPAEGAARIDLEVELAEGDGAAVPRYLPAKVMKPKVVEWIDRALLAGRIDRGELVWRGKVSDFPHEDASGRFAAELDVSGARLNYARRWPGALTGDGRIRFDGRSLVVEAPRARLFGSEIRSLTASVDDFADARLSIRADARGPLADLVRLINGGPLQERLGAMFEGAHADGRAALALALDIPLRDPDATRANGEIRLSDGRFAQRRFGLELTGLDGVIRFTDDGLAIDDLAARLGGAPIRIDAQTRPGDAGRIRVDVRGRLGIEALLPGLPTVLAERLQGSAPWHLAVHVPIGPEGRDRPLVINGTSDLVGTAVDLPAPFGKTADTRRVLRFELPVDRDGGLRPGQVEYGDRFRAVLDLAGRRGDLRLAGGRIRFGREPLAPLGEADPSGIRVRGRIEELDLAGWAALARAGALDGHEGRDRTPADVDVRIERATYGNYVVADLRLLAERTGAGWQLQIDGEQAAGRANVPARPAGTAQPVRVRLERLAPTPLDANDEPGRTDEAPPLEPARVPPLDLRIEHLALPTGELHKVALVTVPVQHGLAIRRLEFSNPDLMLEGSGHWRGRDSQRTAVSLELRSDDFGAGLQALGLGGALGRGDGRITADVEWSGPPWEPSLAALQGETRIRLHDGVFKPVDPGLARIFGLLDLRAMLEYGYQFDEFEGRVDFADAQAITDNLTIDGSAGELRIRGRTGLIARDYDHTIIYRPELSRSLPLFGALSGGPVAGLTVALIQGVLRNLGADMESAVELTYTLTGPWDDPNVERVMTDPDGPERGPRSTAGDGDQH